jgi:cell shape-determining protein MreC
MATKKTEKTEFELQMKPSEVVRITGLKREMTKLDSILGHLKTIAGEDVSISKVLKEERDQFISFDVIITGKADICKQLVGVLMESVSKYS